jgi:hypothetical protein
LSNIGDTVFKAGVVTRVTALWAFSEAFLGGILHGFKLPFAGLALSLMAAVCMALIAANDNAKGVILKATLVVLAVKFVLSPHTPPMAYVAVLIEGLAGELFLMRRKLLPAGAFLLTMFCQLYSAFQHLLILTVVFGKGFWAALDVFLNGITKTFIKQSQQYSLYLVLFYISCYFITGLLGGIFCSRLIKKIQSGKVPAIVNEFANADAAPKTFGIVAETPVLKKKGLSVKYILAGLLLLLLIASYTPLFNGTVLKSKVGEIILRALLIMLAWNFVLSPLLIKFMGKWVEKYKIKKGTAIQQVILLLPAIKNMVQFSWQKAGEVNRFKKMQHFLSNTAMLIIYG